MPGAKVATAKKSATAKKAPAKRALKKAAEPKATPEAAKPKASLIEKVHALTADIEAEIGEWKEPALTHLNAIRSADAGLRSAEATKAGRERPDDSWKASR